MSTDEQNSVLHRKMQGGRTEFDARVMSPSKALRLSIAKTAAKMFNLAITVTTVEQLKLPHAGIQKEAGDDGLLLLFDGASGARAAVKVDRQFLTALIEVQTMGKVRRQEAEARPVTQTDAAIVAPLLDTVLTRYDDQLSEADPEFVPENFRFGDMIEDARSLSLALEAPVFDLFRLTLDVDDGAKTGLLTLLLPQREAAPAARKAGVEPAKNAFSLEKNALEAQVVMTAVLSRLKLPINKICNLEPGAVLPLGTGCLTKAQLVAGDGQAVARVRMGQMNGMRAVRLVSSGVADMGLDSSEGSPPKSASANRLAGGEAPVPPRGDLLEGIAHAVPGATAEPEPSDGSVPAAASEAQISADMLMAAGSTAEPGGETHEDA